MQLLSTYKQMILKQDYAFKKWPENIHIFTTNMC